MQLDAPKGADHSGYQQIIRPSLEMRAGLKILVSLVWVKPARLGPAGPLAAGGPVAQPAKPAGSGSFSKSPESRTSAGASTSQSGPPQPCTERRLADGER